ncbi:hypothetical protein [Kangiella sp. M94]
MKIWAKTITSVSALAVMLLLAMGSEDPPARLIDQTNKSKVPIQYGVVQEGMRIVAEDGSFELKGGQRFTSPFQSDLWGYGCNNFSDKDVLTKANDVLLCGAKKVKVYYGNNPEPLYGVLALNQAIQAAHGPASRSYMIKIAEDKIQHARAGNTSVTFEYMNWTESKRWSHNYSQQKNEKTWYSWILWVSAYPM